MCQKRDRTCKNLLQAQYKSGQKYYWSIWWIISIRLYFVVVQWIYVLSFMPPSAQRSHPVICGCRESAVEGGGGGQGVRVGGQTYWSTNDFDTFRPAPERTQSLLGGCLLVVLRGSAWLSPENEAFTHSVCAPLGVHASFGNAWMQVW